MQSQEQSLRKALAQLDKSTDTLQAEKNEESSRLERPKPGPTSHMFNLEGQTLLARVHVKSELHCFWLWQSHKSV